VIVRGAFITIEGAEGVGKTSSLDIAESCLRARGLRIRVSREPGGTPLGELIRDWILHGEHGALSADVEALLMFAARAQHLDTVIRPALAAGQWVVCDRFSDATFAYQGGGHGANTAFLHDLETGVQRGLNPDLTLLLDAPVDIGLGRIAGREHDHFEREQRDFFERVRKTYLARATAEPERFCIIDASQPRGDVDAAIARELSAFADRFSRTADNGK
jgi:dTMP kinase